MKNLTTFILTTLSFFSICQNTFEDYSFKDSKKIVKINLGDIFSTTPAIGLYVESKVNEDVSLQFGAGIIPSFFQPWVGNRVNDFDQLRGYQLSAESRFYVFKKPTRYIAAEVDFRHLIIRDRNVPIGVDVFENPNGPDEFAYFLNTDMRFHQFNTGLTVKWGFQKHLGENFTFDFNLGMRLSTTNVQSRSIIPAGGTLQETWNNRLTLVDNFKRSRTLPNIGLKIGYRL
ncbi:MAG: hypothetical protein AB8B74_04565 [Crocinitomicaceae bacterium]